MGVLKNLHGMTRSEQKEFFDSFDQVLFEIKDSIDGKVNILPDKLSTIKYFGKIKKDVRYLTDNSGSKTETVVDYLHQQNIVTQREDVFRPIESVIAYFKNKGFKKEIFVIGSSLLKEELEHAGFDLAEEVPKEIGKNFRGVFVNNKDNSNVGAVILDHNFNLSFIMLQKAFWCLGSPDCELITINPEKEIVTEQGNILGIYYFVKTLKDITKKLEVNLGQYSQHYHEALAKKFQISDPKRILYIRELDTKYKEIEIEENFQEILILNGTDEQREDELKKHMNSNCKYFVENWDSLNKILRDVY
ncbi:uncharacterized protein LOC114329712 [Diabrotica virgifera virgifera]|uniref:DUF4263 domain-containing protein n=1 Tax=Diabrotica virgifera virgifera TaxID=50390 RepID=A0ABM5KAS3_DIAVI|nr:uncharacterized protein LOC114329712 [Diabrotica virgifera virgifera]